ncbi:M18 family aminopeptidase [Dietzia sp.]|uniref:M18 family aminopeptidase n=1 Tax=Dietzia sp. TaxID=1871616 RepID=UPI002FD94FFF
MSTLTSAFPGSSGADSRAADFIDFVAASPSSFHTATEVGRRLLAAGFTEQDEAEDWDSEPGGHFVIRGGAIVAWFVPEGASPSSSGFRIVGAHTDSPGFSLKPRGDLAFKRWQQAPVEVYGGPLLHTWFDRELELAGRVVFADGSTHLVRTGPWLRIPSLAIHLDRGVNSKLELDPERHVQPIFGNSVRPGGLLQILAEDVAAENGLAPGTAIVSHDLITVDAQRGERFGVAREFLAAGRLDNLTSVHTGLEALLAAASDPPGDDILVLAAFDHEEVGSGTTSGASGPLLEDVLLRTAAGLGADLERSRQMFARSMCVSADAAHAVHPNYPEAHDRGHHPFVGGGPVIKINAKARYASDAGTVALFIAACAEAQVPYQHFVSDNRVPCGSTIGPLTATRLGIDTVDVGVPLLSMHSAREMCGVADLGSLAASLDAFFRMA